MTFIDYQDKRVVVTGASSGIGAAVATALVKLGAEVHAAARREPEAKSAEFHPLDLSDPASIEGAVHSIGGPVDALFNCAGAVPMSPALDILKVNFLGTRLFTDLVAANMTAGGAIVNTSSDGGYGWRHKRTLLLDFVSHDFDDALEWYVRNQEAAGHADAFAKEALNVWTMQQSAVLIQRGIRINTASPGAVQTPMLEAIEAAYSTEAIDPVLYPSGRRSTAEEQVGPLLFLNSDSASYVNGADLSVDGGFWASLSLTGSLWNSDGGLK
ncbi:coniferyl-alcohol dehydrogenase [Herbiconiux ginsengi]|uniref:NAD(P)-dependent dehydrogenase, short-chain alcohol dehydrogenase family n=1 Tax=Herbiconiux ginsengi TaxID=381665 RepID=A0A1H3TE00_9MICO|nr:coniferyl-alcohol dehydrogenase [Herbiconiux ginsengi]SDZ47579.1 NAD(P)-dependent dehydrogenase, short-chain alcohol dehydrogenase family [Herbiconiux ginsengi]